MSLKRYRDPSERPLLSVCTILILSGFLLGFATSDKFGSEMRIYMYSAGFLGILAFLALDHVRERRRRQAEAIEQMLVEERLARHVDSCTGWSDLRRETDELDALATIEESSLIEAAVSVAG
ncbi:MAG: hypothetical protein R3B91_23030 [Planctomycetaceae bacterium]|nr:hypothetical protein [Planctomycetaceae bacterium]